MQNASAASLLHKLFSCTSKAEAILFVSSRRCTQQQRRSLAQLSGLTPSWINCDQKIKGNVKDLAEQIMTELYEPFWFYRSSLFTTVANAQPPALFQAKQATPPLKRQKSLFWVAPHGTKKTTWLPSPSQRQTFGAVVHFVQAGSGTGVHVGNGKILTCAHVIDARSDEELVDIIPNRIGRQKVVMFSSGRTFLTECAANLETLDGTQDVAVVMLGVEINVQLLPSSIEDTEDTQVPDHAQKTNSGTVPDADIDVDADNLDHLPVALIGTDSPLVGDLLFCVGNPSSIDLETFGDGGTIEFEPPTWHVSTGRCEGYQDPSVHALREVEQARGRAPTRGEKKKYMEAAAKVYTNLDDGLFIHHSAWTYWGHSGAPLFNEGGQVVGLHCAWDDHNGMRHGQKLCHLIKIVDSVDGKLAESRETETISIGNGRKKKRQKRK
jgi:hypothetical protein